MFNFIQSLFNYYITHKILHWRNKWFKSKEQFNNYFNKEVEWQENNKALKPK